MKNIFHFIGGKEFSGGSNRFSNIYNPATGEVQAKVNLATSPKLIMVLTLHLKLFKSGLTLHQYQEHEYYLSLKS